jgi:hypothetical protein
VAHAKNERAVVHNEPGELVCGVRPSGLLAH